MTVNQLIEELRKAADAGLGDAIVIMQKDAEGNGYSPLYDVEADAVYVAESTWSGDCPLPEDQEEGVGVPCVILGPTN